jgi:protein SCO1
MIGNLAPRLRLLTTVSVLLAGLLILASCRGEPELIGTDMEGQQAPPFHLIDHRGQEVRLSDLQGKAVALTFIFTNCPDVCPLIVNRMRLAYEDLPDNTKENVALVAITVDPERDTVEAMREYSETRGVGGIENWYALTAPLEVLEPLWEAYFVTPGERYPADPDIVAAMEAGEHDPEKFMEDQQSGQESDHDHGNGEDEDGTAYWLAHTDVIYFIDPDGLVQVLLRGDYTSEDLVHNLRILAP